MNLRQQINYWMEMAQLRARAAIKMQEENKQLKEKIVSLEEENRNLKALNDIEKPIKKWVKDKCHFEASQNDNENIYEDDYHFPNQSIYKG